MLTLDEVHISYATILSRVKCHLSEMVKSICSRCRELDMTTQKQIPWSLVRERNEKDAKIWYRERLPSTQFQRSKSSARAPQPTVCLWADHIPSVASSYRSSAPSSTGPTAKHVDDSVQLYSSHVFLAQTAFLPIITSH